jgi:hypothetical protein
MVSCKHAPIEQQNDSGYLGSETDPIVISDSSSVDKMRSRDSVQLSKIKLDSPYYVIIFYNLNMYGIIKKTDSITYLNKIEKDFGIYSMGGSHDYVFSFKTGTVNATKFKSKSEAITAYKEYVFYHSDYPLKYKIIDSN